MDTLAQSTRSRWTNENISIEFVSSCVVLEYLYVLTCKGLRIAAVRHLKNAGGPAGLGPQVRGRKWCHAVRCCPVLFVWQPHCTRGLPTGWELMGLAPHTFFFCLFLFFYIFPRPHWSVHTQHRCSVSDQRTSRGPWRRSRGSAVGLRASYLLSTDLRIIFIINLRL